MQDLIYMAVKAAAEAAAAVFVSLPRNHYELDGMTGELSLGDAADTAADPIRFHLRCVKAEVADSRASRWLLVEFGERPRQLEGLVFALPYFPGSGGKRIIGGMVRVWHCPDSALALIDDLLPYFLYLLRNAEKGAWLEALEYDGREPPSQEKYEAGAPKIEACCPQLDPDSLEDNLNIAASRYLDALAEDYGFEGGLSFRAALRQLKCDFSAASLARIDQLLEQIKTRLKPKRDDFLGHADNRNFLYLLALYCGRVIATATQSSIDWYTPQQWREKSPPAEAAADKSEAPLAVFNDVPGGVTCLFSPMSLLKERLFGALDSQGFRDRLKELAREVKPGRPQRLEHVGPAILSLLEVSRERDQPYLSLRAPHWIDDDRLSLWYEQYPKLFRGGRLVWGVVVQANSSMFKDGDNACPGEVLYDPRGVLSPAQLIFVARNIYAYKGGQPPDPRIAFIAAYLSHELSRVFGLKVPRALSSDDLRISTTMFVRQHLPGNKLNSWMVPLWINDGCPGIVAVLPERFWGPDMKAFCAEYGWSD